VSLLVQRVPITTDGTGADQSTVNLGPCVLRMVRLELGTLTTPDIDLTEQDNNRTILTVAAVAADTDYFPAVAGSDDTGADVEALPAPIIGRLQLDVAGGGANKTGELTILYER
jgi:hypothetical protein